MKKVCLITGASRGLGLSLAKILGNDYMIVGVARSEENLKTLVQDGILDHFIVADLSRPESIDKMIQDFEQQYHKLDLLINNAAIQSYYNIVDSHSYNRLVQTEMQVNFLAPVQITSALLPLLIKGRGRIVNISSLLQFCPKYNSPGYCASKAALSNWTTNLRAQLKGPGVSVLEVIPGLIKTTMTMDCSETGIEPDLLAKETVYKLERKKAVLKGAKLGWFVSQLLPFVFNKIILKNKE